MTDDEGHKWNETFLAVLVANGADPVAMWREFKQSGFMLSGSFVYARYPLLWDQYNTVLYIRQRVVR